LAADLYDRLLRSIVRRLVTARVAPVELLCADSVNHPTFVDLEASFALQRGIQVEGSLGQRLAEGARAALAHCSRAVLIGADCPGLNADYVREIILRLGPNSPIVLGPAEDGGYVAIGLTAFDPLLFSHIDWGSDRVLNQTLQRLHRLGWRYALMPTLWDVDRPEDLERLRREHPTILGGL
jgi:rSAM/selenodomain-associated transferase 1